MTRTKTLAHYRSIRADICRHLACAQDVATREEFLGAAKMLSVAQNDNTIVASEEGFEMVVDTVLFVPDEAGNRVIDRCATGLADREERAFARRLAGGRLSVWEIVGKHPLGGVLVDDAIGRRKRRHLMDEALARTAKPGMFLTMRLFDAGPFACGFGIVIPMSRLETMLLEAAALPQTHLQLIVYTCAIHDVPVSEMLVGLAQEEARAA
jgi:hypothetical protein